MLPIVCSLILRLREAAITCCDAAVPSKLETLVMRKTRNMQEVLRHRLINVLIN